MLNNPYLTFGVTYNGVDYEGTNEKLILMRAWINMNNTIMGIIMTLYAMAALFKKCNI